jgi:hypothetical protein
MPLMDEEIPEAAPMPAIDSWAMQAFDITAPATHNAMPGASLLKLKPCFLVIEFRMKLPSCLDLGNIFSILATSTSFRVNRR